MSHPQPLPDRNSEGLQRVATWVDLVNAEPHQTERRREEISPIARWDDDQQVQPLTFGIGSHINILEQTNPQSLGQTDTRSRSVSLSRISPRPSTVEIEKSSRRRGSKPTQQYNPSETHVPGISQGEGGAASTSVSKRSSIYRIDMVLKNLTGKTAQMTSVTLRRFRDVLICFIAARSFAIDTAWRFCD